MKRRNEDLYGLELLELILADKTKDDDQRIVNFKNYVRQLKTENDRRVKLACIMPTALL